MEHIMEFTEIEAKELVHDKENPRKHGEENFAAIRASLLAHGQVEPLVIQRSTNMVIAGNARLRVLKDLGYKKVKAVLLDVDDKEARKLSIVLNRSGELAEWNEANLAKHLEELSSDANFSSLDLGFSMEDMEELVNAFGGTIETLDFDEPSIEEEGFSDGYDDEDDSEEDINPTQVSNIRMVQLMLNDETIGLFQDMIKAISNNFGTENITDTVYQAIELVYNGMERVEE
jgi:hypothetical protein